ncbi:MAG: hypothetical protein GTO18_16430 [Anaerolineales bacterium]|nr:hypothetical protein [Anaerolineales bacterium]
MLRGTTLLAWKFQAALDRDNGRFPPPVTHNFTGEGCPVGAAGEFSLCAPRSPCQVYTVPSSLADDLLLLL